MSGFSADVAAQPAVIRRVVAAASGRLDGPLDAAAALVDRHPTGRSPWSGWAARSPRAASSRRSSRPLDGW